MIKTNEKRQLQMWCSALNVLPQDGMCDHANLGASTKPLLVNSSISFFINLVIQLKFRWLTEEKLLL